MNDLYPHNAEKQLNMALFMNPPAEYRGAPFWSWNNKLDLEQLFRQIEVFKKMGFGGGHMHPRTGLGTEYMSDEFCNIVKNCAQKFKAENMLGWLYDEDRWPSGFAGGLATKEEKFRTRYLLFTPTPYSGVKGKPPHLRPSRAGGYRNEKGELLCRYRILLDAQGCLESYRLIAPDEKPDALAKNETIWYLYCEVAAPNSWFNHQSYVDCLNPAAIRKFIAVTHEKYAAVVGAEFGATIPAIFTDEPQFAHKKILPAPLASEDVFLPYTEALPVAYEKEYGADFFATFPEIIWQLPDNQPSISRYRFHDFTSELFARAFADQLGAWCQRHNLLLTGHMMHENTLESQTGAIGEAMRSYRGFQLPGIDMLCDADEFTTAKQAQSAARQYGCPGVLSELYGVTGWNFDFAGHKRQGDWQAALGVSVRVPHLAWVSMAGEAKRDYPASISYQSPWWQEYAIVEDHFARVNTVMTRGKPVCKVAMLHPIESFWLSYGPTSQTIGERQERDANFANSVEWLLKGLIDFDFIAESLLPTQKVKVERQKLCVGEMAYETIIVPGLKTMRATTLNWLKEFAAKGGRVIFMGEIPRYIDVVATTAGQAFAAECEQIAFTKNALLTALTAEAAITLTDQAGQRGADFVYQLREDGAARYLFICNTTKKRQRPPQRFNLAIKGEWVVSLLNTLNGKEEAVAAEYAAGKTRLVWDVLAQGHLLLKLTAGKSVADKNLLFEPGVEIAQLAAPVRVALSEPNALLLDQPEWRVDGGQWQPREEMLRLANKVRAKFGYAPQSGHIAQPWVERPAAAKICDLELRFTIDCQHAVAQCQLALEQPENWEIYLDGDKVVINDCGWWTDEAIRKINLGKLAAAKHELILRLAYSAATSLEWCYLLGDFGVKLSGRESVITPPVRELHFSDWTTQGLPFYSGNVTYYLEYESNRDKFFLNIPHYQGAAIVIDEAGTRVANLAFEPFAAALAGKGKHQYAVTLLGTRENSFGALHWADKSGWYGPQSWRVTGAEWLYEYNLAPMGILAAPRILAYSGA